MQNTPEPRQHKTGLRKSESSRHSASSAHSAQFQTHPGELKTYVFPAAARQYLWATGTHRSLRFPSCFASSFWENGQLQPWLGDRKPGGAGLSVRSPAVRGGYSRSAPYAKLNLTAPAAPSVHPRTPATLTARTQRRRAQAGWGGQRGRNPARA